MESIIRLNNELCELEIKGLQYTEEYEKKLDYYEMVVEAEDDLYEQYDRDLMQLQKIANYYWNTYVDDEEFLGENFDSILSNNLNHIKCRRFIDSVNEMDLMRKCKVDNYKVCISSKDEEENEEYEDEEYEYLTDSYLDAEINASKETAHRIKIEVIRELDKLFLSIIEDSSNKENIRKKYQFALIDRVIEHSLLFQKFYAKNLIVPEIRKPKQDENIFEYNEIRKVLFDELNIQTNLLTNKELFDLDDNMCYLIQCRYRAVLVLFDTEDLEDLQDQLSEKIEECPGKYFALEAFNYVKSDKNEAGHIKILSLRK